MSISGCDRAVEKWWVLLVEEEEEEEEEEEIYRGYSVDISCPSLFYFFVLYPFLLSECKGQSSSLVEAPL